MPNEYWDYFHLKPIRLDFSHSGLKSPEEPAQCQVESDIPGDIIHVQEGSGQQDVLARGLPRPSPPPPPRANFMRSTKVSQVKKKKFSNCKGRNVALRIMIDEGQNETKKPPQEENHIPDELGDFQKDTVQDQSAKKPSVQKKKAATFFREEA